MTGGHQQASCIPCAPLHFWWLCAPVLHRAVFGVATGCCIHGCGTHGLPCKQQLWPTKRLPHWLHEPRCLLVPSVVRAIVILGLVHQEACSAGWLAWGLLPACCCTQRGVSKLSLGKQDPSWQDFSLPMPATAMSEVPAVVAAWGRGSTGPVHRSVYLPGRLAATVQMSVCSCVYIRAVASRWDACGLPGAPACRLGFRA